MPRRDLVPSEVTSRALHGLGGDQLAALLPWPAHSEGWTWEVWNRAVAQWRTPTPTRRERRRLRWRALAGRVRRSFSRGMVERQGDPPDEVGSASTLGYPFNPVYGLTFTNAPADERDGRRYVRSEAGLELARRIIREDAELLRRLADE